MRSQLFKSCLALTGLIFVGHTVRAESTARPYKTVGPYKFENLGVAMPSDPLTVEFVTRDKQGHAIAWANLKDAKRRALLGVKMDSGELITVDLAKYGESNRNEFVKFDENTIFIYSGNPGRFFKYDIARAELTPVGEPTKATYWMTHIVAPDGKIYVGAYPNANVAVLDPATGKAEELGRLSPDTREQYVTVPAAGDDNIVYFPVGLHHAELWAFNPKTGERKQILPPDLTKKHGAPKVWTGTDGQVYGSLDGTAFRCKPTAIELGKTAPAREATPDNKANGRVAKWIDAKGNLVLEDSKSKQTTLLPTTFQASGPKVFSIGDVRNGKLYGSSIKPGRTFSYNLKTGEKEDLGRLARGSIQVYDTLSYGKGLYLSSYTGGYIDFYDPTRRRVTGKNPRPIVQLSLSDMQERPVQLVVGLDKMIYSVSFPVKGILGGALIRVNPQDDSTKVWRNVIPNQSYTSVAPVPETGEMFVTTTIAGGSSAVPSEKEACVFLWDTKQEKITWRGQPIAGAKAYGKAVRADNGLIYGFAGSKYYVFDPVKRQVVYTGDVPTASAQNPDARTPLLCDAPAGPQGLIYGVDTLEGTIFAIDPASHKARAITSDESLRNTIAVNMAPDGYLYYGSDADLMRCKLIP